VRSHPSALAALFVLLTPAFSLPSLAANPAQGPGQLPRLGANANDQDDHTEEQRAKIEKDMAKKANRERQAQLQRDTDNLVKLANELKQSVDKSNENTLSLDVVKKAEEIEKLAHSVKEKMKAN
jgi:Spy/CpxP family protein refolding chaperone